MYKTTASTTGYGSPNFGSAKLAQSIYGDLGMTLLKARLNNKTGVAVNDVVVSLGPFAQEVGLRVEDSTDSGVYHRNPIDQKKALYSSVFLSGIGLASATASYQAVRDKNMLYAAIFGAASLAGFAALPNWELRI